MKRKDGFQGEKHIYIPENAWKAAIEHNSVMGQLYITSIGYFPNATYHYRERPNGCSENILIYCLRGKGWFLLNDKKLDVGANQFIIVPSTTLKMTYGADESEPWTIYWIHFSGKNIQQFNDGFNIGIFDGARDINYNEKGIELWESIYESLLMGYGNEILNNVNLCLYHLLATFLYAEKHTNTELNLDKDIVKKTILFMQEQLHQKCSLEIFAKNNHLSMSHFSNLFKKATGMPPMDYFIHLKMIKACSMLYSTDTKVHEIANSLGYSDAFHFSRLFKKNMKVSPKRYRLLRKKKITSLD